MLSRWDQIARPHTWIPYRNGLCDGCFAGCCSLPVEVSAADLERLGLITADETQGSLKKVSKRLMKDGVVQQFVARTGIFVMAQKPSPSGGGYECIYLGADRRCTVYEKRPEVCRQFPKIGPKPGYCPGQIRREGKGK